MVLDRGTCACALATKGRRATDNHAFRTRGDAAMSPRDSKTREQTSAVVALSAIRESTVAPRQRIRVRRRTSLPRADLPRSAELRKGAKLYPQAAAPLGMHLQRQNGLTDQDRAIDR